MWLRRPSPIRPRLVYPLEPIPRVAVIGRAVEPEPNIAVFVDYDAVALRRYSPQALAAPLSLLRMIASHGDAAPTLTHAVIAFTREDDELTEADRHWFWQVFRVPLFEQQLTANGELAAWECEAHSVLHAAGESGEEQCACGRAARLLVPVAANR